MYRYIPRESCSQFDSLPLTSLTIFLLSRELQPEAAEAETEAEAEAEAAGEKQLERLASDTWGSTNCSIKSRRCAPTSRHRRSARRFSLEILRRAARRMRRASTRGSVLPARSVRFTTIRFTICSAKLWDTSA